MFGLQVTTFSNPLRSGKKSQPEVRTDWRNKRQACEDVGFNLVFFRNPLKQLDGNNRQQTKKKTSKQETSI